MNRHESADNNEANCRWHHSLLPQMGQLVDRERVLRCENDQLRAQLVEMKQQEKKKYDALMVQYCQLTNTKQVTVKCEWNYEDVKEEMCDGAELVQNSNYIYIKREHLDEQSDNGQAQQMDNQDPSTNTHNVPMNIKTESMDCDFVVVKEEIKEEDDYDCDGRDRFVVKREMVSDDDDDSSMQLDDSVDQVMQSNSNQSNDSLSPDQINTVNNSVLQWDAASPNEQQIQVTNSDLVIEECGNQQVIGANGEIINHGNGLADEDEENLVGDEELINTANDNHDRSVVVSNELSTSSLRRSNRITSKQPTVSTPQIVPKRKQSQSNRTVKKSKKTTEDNTGEEGNEEEIANEDQTDNKIKMIYLNCTESNCEIKLNSLVQLHNHLHTGHQLLPLRCFAVNCNSRTDNRAQMGVLIKQQLSSPTQFVCHVCHKVASSQGNAYMHWNQCHLN